MKNFGIREGYTAREQPAYFHDVQPDGKIWQPDVVPMAVHIARKAGRKTLIDIGCGRGEKLLPYGGEFQLVGLDYGTNIEYCKTTYPFGRWIECNLETDYPKIGADLLRHAVVICSDVIEHLIKPTRLVGWLNADALYSPCIVTTPDRERVYGYDQNGPPGNVHHVREWTLRELRGYLGTFGLEASWAGWTLNNNVDRLFHTSCLYFGNPAYTEDIERIFQLERCND